MSSAFSFGPSLSLLSEFFPPHKNENKNENKNKKHSPLPPPK